MNTMEKWYKWDGDVTRDMQFIKKVKSVKFSDGSFLIDIDDSSPFRRGPIMWYCWQAWSNTNVVAYSLGEKIESKRKGEK